MDILDAIYAYTNMQTKLFIKILNQKIRLEETLKFSKAEMHPKIYIQ